MTKKYLLATLMMLLPILAAAQDIILMQNGDILLAKVIEIGEKEVIYDEYDAPGQSLHIPVGKILKINFANGREELFMSSAQQIDRSAISANPWLVEEDVILPKEYLKCDKSMLFNVFNGEGEKINDQLDLYLDPIELGQVKRDRFMAKVTLGLLAGSSGALVFGGTEFVYGLVKKDKPYIKTGAIVFSFGLGALLAGLSIGNVFSQDLVKLLEEHNQNKGFAYELNMGAAPHGVGLTFNF